MLIETMMIGNARELPSFNFFVFIARISEEKDLLQLLVTQITATKSKEKGLSLD